MAPWGLTPSATTSQGVESIVMLGRSQEVKARDFDSRIPGSNPGAPAIHKGSELL